MVGIVTPLALVFGSLASAQSLLEFDRWMQRIDRRSQSVQRNLTNRNAADAIADAHEIEELYGLMEGYFLRRGNADVAVKLSREGKELAAQVARSVDSGDFPTALAAAISVSRACRSCHVQFKPLD